MPNNSITTKSAQRAYLQSLDRSSRAWVLSSAKTQASSKASGLPEESGSNIWYNPIPEEEDAGGPPREDEVWRRRDQTDGRGTPKRLGQGDSRPDWPRAVKNVSSNFQPDGANPNVSHHIDDITAENTGTKSCAPPLLILYQFNSTDCSVFFSPEYPTADSSPTSQKKASVTGSVMDRLRSPGTVRKLSLKMKKLPELRRKLSLRSSSRGHRQGNDVRGGEDESMSKSATSSATLSNQYVISRYHLDSSAAPARPLRRTSRGRSGSKGGKMFTHNPKGTKYFQDKPCMLSHHKSFSQRTDRC